MLKTFIGHDLHETIEINRIYSIFQNAFTPNFSTKGESHDFWEFVYVENGQLLVDTLNNQYTLSQGEFLLHKPKEFHRHYVLDHTAMLFITSFDCSAIALNSISDTVIKLNPFARMLTKESIIVANKIFQKVNDDFIFTKYTSYNNEYEQILSNILEAIFLSILTQSKENIPLQITINDRLKDEKNISDLIMNHLQEHIFDALTIDDLTETLHISKTSLSTKFKTETGRSIMDYYCHLRILKSLELLTINNMAISDIAYKMNFSSTQYFSKVFKKYTGTSPGAYKKNIANIGIGVRKN